MAVFEFESLDFSGTIGAVAKGLVAALWVAGLIPTRNKYLNGLQINLPGLAICVNELKCL